METTPWPGPDRGPAFTLLLEAAHGPADRHSEAERLLAGAPAAVWTALDRWMRAERWTDPWRRPSSVVLDELPGAPVLFAGLASCHRDGHVREAAAARLAELGDPLTAPFLAVRCADWVEQVRARASLALWARVGPDNIAELRLAAPVLVALGGRRHGREHLERLQALLAAPGAADARRALLGVGDRPTRRLVYRRAVEAGLLTLDELVAGATGAGDITIQTACGERAVELALAVGRRDVVERLLRAGVARVRAAAVEAAALVDGAPDGAADRYLFDRSALVRATAQFCLRRAGRDPTAAYRAALARPPGDVPPVALVELGRLGDQDDGALLAGFLVAERTPLRRAAVLALYRLGHPRLVDLLVPLLTDSEPPVVRAAVRGLRPQAGRLDHDLLDALADPVFDDHVRLGGLRLAQARDLWTRLAADLRAFADPAHPVRALASQDLGNWLRRGAAETYQRAAGEDRARLEAALRVAEPHLDPGRRRQVAFHLGLPG